jgi:hypothetical protein
MPGSADPLLDWVSVAIHRKIEELAGHHELRRSIASREVATGTLACPDCDAPVLPHVGGMSPADPLSCAFCEHAGFVRDFLSLGEPTRPTHVVVRVRGLALR